MIDFDRINQAALLCLESLCCELLPGGERDGREYKVGDLGGGKGRSMSVNLRTGVWKDFAGDESGSDPISLVAAVMRVKMGEAAKWLNDRLNAGGFPEAKAPVAKSAKGSDPEDWTPLPHVPDGCKEQPPEKHHKLGKPVLRWAYFTAEGKLAGYVCRFEWVENGDTHKDVIPTTWCRHTNGKEGWRWKAFLQPRLLYRLPEVIARADATVLIVEGEKTADAAQRLLPQVVVTAWAGGCKAVAYADFSSLKGRRVILWPDADRKTLKDSPDLLPEDKQPGWVAMERARERITEAGAESCRLIPPPLGLTKDGWDLADAEAEGITADFILAHIKATKEGTRLTVPVAATVEEEPPAYDAPPEGLHDHGEPPSMGEEKLIFDPNPFRILGHDHGTFFYLPNDGRQVVALTASAHTSSNLLQLAGIQHWEMEFPGKKGANWLAAANHLMRRAFAVGIFSEKRKRGRGCWMDAGRVVYHVGDRLSVDGKPCALHEFKSSFIYELADSMEPESAKPLPAEEASKVIRLCSMLAWNRPIDAYLLAGWCVIAPICGALDYRPSIWVTGPSMSGKSWTLTNIVRALLGHSAVEAQGNSTEAGLRAALQSDARPVVFDEAESEDHQGQARLASIMQLIRTSTSDDSPPILKGDQSGRGKSYLIRSCFAFSAIGVAASKQADVSRITPLVLRRVRDEKRFAEIKEFWAGCMADPLFCQGIRARTLQLAAVISENARRFAISVTKRTSEVRLGQQLGTMLAGAYSLSSSKIITQDQADAWVNERDWSVFAPDETEDDHNRAFNRLMETIITLDAAKDRPIQKMTIAEFIDAALNADHTDVRRETADLLGRYGIKVVDMGDDAGVYVANNHKELANIFRDTEWSGTWKVPLSRVKGATNTKTPIRINKFVTQRAVKLPLELFRDQ